MTDLQRTGISDAEDLPQTVRSTTKSPGTGNTTAAGAKENSMKHWRRLYPGRDNLREVDAARMKLEEEITREEVTRKSKVRGLMFPRW